MAGCFEHGTENFGLIKLGNCLISWGTTSFSRWTLLRGLISVCKSNLPNDLPVVTPCSIQASARRLLDTVDVTVIADNCWELTVVASAVICAIYNSKTHCRIVLSAFKKRRWREKITFFLTKIQANSLHADFWNECVGKEIYNICACCVVLNM